MGYPFDGSVLPPSKATGQGLSAAEFDRLLTALGDLGTAAIRAPYVGFANDTSMPVAPAGEVRMRSSAGRLQVSQNGQPYRDVFPHFNVKDFGAVGDGATDDTVAIQAANDAAEAAGGGDVIYPPGTYAVCIHAGTRISAEEAAIWVGESNVRHVGLGRGCVTIKMFAPGLADPLLAYQVTQTSGLAAWQANHTYSIGAAVLANGHEWECTTGGVSAASVGPVLPGSPTVVGGEVHIVDNGVTWRYRDHLYVGHVFKLKKKTRQNVDYLRNVAIVDIVVDAQTGWPQADFPFSGGVNCPYTNGGWTEVTAGKVYESHNQIVRIDGDLIDNVRLEGCYFKNNRSEAVYYGGSTLTNLHVTDCDFDNTAGSSLSVTGSMVVSRCRFQNAGESFECFHRKFDVLVQGCSFYNVMQAMVDGGNVDLTDAPWGKLTVRDCKFQQVWVRGFNNSGYGQNYEIASNLFIDCGITSVDQEAIRIASGFGGATRNVWVHHNQILADAHNPFAGITLAGIMSYVDISDNVFGQTQLGVTNSKFVANPINTLLDSSSTLVRFRNNKWRTSGGAHVGTVAAAEYTGFWEPNNISLQDGGLAFQIQNTSGSTDMYLKASRHVIGGNTSHAYTSTGSLLNSDHMDNFQQVLIQSSGSSINENYCSIPQTSSGHDLKTKRFLSDKVSLLVQKDQASGKWKEVDYYLTANHGEVTANDLDLLSPNRLIDLAPVIEAYGTKRVSLAPTGATDFNNWADFPTDTDVRVVINGNATLKHNAGSTNKLILSGAADWAPGGTGGETVFRVPGGSSKAYEVGPRFAY